MTEWVIEWLGVGNRLFWSLSGQLFGGNMSH
jgi:hypothetical protein